MQARSGVPAGYSFVALGDSFTEGIGDMAGAPGDLAEGIGDVGWAPGSFAGPAEGVPADGIGPGGWADRFADRLAEVRPGLCYANLAVRGKLLREVGAEQVPRAIAMRPDLVSLAAGGNDLLRWRADPDLLGQIIDDQVRKLTEAGCGVLLFAGFDPGTFPLIRLIRRRAAIFNAHIRVAARRHGCSLVDLWSMRILRDPREWCADRLHLSPDGHRRVALRACEVMGVTVDEDWRDPLPAEPVPAAALARAGQLLTARRQDGRWAREHGAPWVSRRLRGVSSGDGALAKRPELLPLANVRTRSS
jgi:lysophospholipase L1-like esterase